MRNEKKSERLNSIQNRWAFSTLQDTMDRMFDQLFADGRILNRNRVDQFAPACDFRENDAQYVISIEVPGISKDQIHLELSGNTLIVSGEQPAESADRSDIVHCHERHHGSFKRRFTLHQAPEGPKVEAVYRDGLLRITVPKAALAKSQTIPIGSGSGMTLRKSPVKEEKKEETRADTNAA